MRLNRIQVAAVVLAVVALGISAMVIVEAAEFHRSAAAGGKWSLRLGGDDGDPWLYDLHRTCFLALYVLVGWNVVRWIKDREPTRWRRWAVCWVLPLAPFTAFRRASGLEAYGWFLMWAGAMLPMVWSTRWYERVIDGMQVEAPESARQYAIGVAFFVLVNLATILRFGATDELERAREPEPAVSRP